MHDEQARSSAADEDLKLAALLRLIRKRQGKTQEVLAELAGVPLRDLVRVENGDVGRVAFSRVRRVFDAVGGKARIWTYFNGESADRLLDERHALLVDKACRICGALQWLTLVEASFSEYGERGSIDLLAARERHRAVAICEVKSAFGSLEEMNRSLDAKVRLASVVAEKRLGWRPQHVGRILIVPRDTTVRRQVERFEATMNAVYPARTREVRAWLRRPTTDIAGIWFVDA